MPTTIKKTSLDMLMGTKNGPAKSAADAPTTAGPTADALAIDALATDAHNGKGAAVNDYDEGPLDSETGQPPHPGTLFEEDGEDALPGVVDDKPVDTEHRPSHDIELTEDFIARAFIDRYGHAHRYDHDDGHWRRWDDTRWKKDETKATFDRARTLCRALRGGERSMSSRRAIEGVEVMARCDPRVAMKSDDWDKDAWVLGTLGGYVDLKTGEVFEPDPSMNVSQLASVSPAEKGTPTPHFSKFLDEVTQSDPELQRFLQQYLGYCLIGVTREQVLLFIFWTRRQWEERAAECRQRHHGRLCKDRRDGDLQRQPSAAPPHGNRDASRRAPGLPVGD